MKCWRLPFLCVVLTAMITVTVGAAQAQTETAARFLIEADETDVQERTVEIDLYAKAETGKFLFSHTLKYTCEINRITGLSKLHICPELDGVWVKVDYLTDLDRDGTYEMLTAGDSGAGDLMKPDATLGAHIVGSPVLEKGREYSLDIKDLQAGAQAALQARAVQGSGQLMPQLDVSKAGEDLVYLVSVYYTSPTDGNEYANCYYLQLYDRTLMPYDVPQWEWYYDAVEYVLEQNILTGTGEKTFSPNGMVTRAQLAQVLWRMGGSTQGTSGVSPLSDVHTDDWFFSAVSWCVGEGLMSGTGTAFLPDAPLTREQLSLVLRNYAAYSGLDTQAGADLSKFADRDAASSWASEGLRWAVENKLLSANAENNLRPQGASLRCELAGMLYRLNELVSASAQNDNDASLNDA